MKKAVFLVLFLAFAVSSYAVDIPDRSIFIEGTASVPAHRTFFLDNFRMEASALGYNIANTRNAAGFIFNFVVQNYADEYDPSIRFIILVTLTHRESGMELVSFGWPFAQLEDMYEHNQFVFFKAAVNIPSLSDAEIAELVRAAQAAEAALLALLSEDIQPIVQALPPDNSWKNKWIYLRASFDYLIQFYKILPQAGELHGGVAAYNPSIPNPNFVHQMEDITYPRPGATVGLEFQLLNFLSLEVNFQIGFGDMQGNDFFINLAAGAELKFPLKMFNNFIISPYGAFHYPIAFSLSPAFIEYPLFFAGGGLQVAVKGGSSGAFFVDVKYLMSLDRFGLDFGRTYMSNPWKPTFPDPPGFHYNRFVVGISVGYKFGIFDR